MELSQRQVADIAAELIARRKAKETLEGFRAYMARTGDLNFKYQPAAHHVILMDALEALERGDTQRLMIMMPPGSAKSTYASVQFICWYLARHPTDKVLCCSNSQHLAESFQRSRRTAMYTDEWQALADTSIDPDNKGLEQFGLIAGGSCRSAGVGSTITGHRANLLVLDDPIVGFEQAMNEGALQKIWDWFIADARTRLLPDGKELIITTRWARNDPAGRILDLISKGHEPGWQVLRLPMECDDPSKDLLGRERGERLWPQHFTDEMVAKARRNPLMWSALYQQTPLNASGSWVANEHLHYEDRVPSLLKYIVGIDLAVSEGKGDYSAIVVAGMDSERRLHVVHVERMRENVEVVAEALFEVCRHYPPFQVLIEDDNVSQVFVRVLGMLARQGKGQPIPLKRTKIGGRDKETRASAIRAQFHMGHVRIKNAAWTNAFVDELLDFPSGPNDDQVDALSLIGAEATRIQPPAQQRPLDRAPIQGAFAYVDGQWRTTQTLDDLWTEHEDRDANNDILRIN